MEKEKLPKSIPLLPFNGAEFYAHVLPKLSAVPSYEVWIFRRGFGVAYMSYGISMDGDTDILTEESIIDLDMAGYFLDIKKDLLKLDNTEVEERESELDINSLPRPIDLLPMDGEEFYAHILTDENEYGINVEIWIFRRNFGVAEYSYGGLFTDGGADITPELVKEMDAKGRFNFEKERLLELE